VDLGEVVLEFGVPELVDGACLAQNPKVARIFQDA
jgi:hypothetical protein